MKKRETGAISTNNLVMYALLSAIVVVLQYMGSFIKMGPFSITLVLVPIVVGAAICGKGAGAWLGFVFSVVVLCTDSAPFLAVSVPGTVVTVLLKGTLAGFFAGLVFDLLKKRNIYIAVIVSALFCPVVNTGIFLIGCRLFFMGIITQWATELGFPSAGNYIIYGLVGLNFLAEVAVNMVLSPIIIRLVNIRKKI